MEFSILVAKILAIVYLSAGIAAAGGKIEFKRVVEDFENSPALTFISGFMTIILGVLLVHYHNRWVADWTVLITLIGWIALVKGVLLIAYPQFMEHFKGWYKHSRYWGYFMIAIGLLFGYFGFMG